MKLHNPLFMKVISAAAAGLLAGCAFNAEISGDALPDFSLQDVNADSTRYQELVSPRDYVGQVSAWYFGHST